MFEKLTPYISAILLAYGIGSTSISSAQTQQELSATTQIHRVLVDAQGKEQLIVLPFIGLNDVVQYTITYTNNSNRMLTNVQVTFRIPDNMTWVANAVQPKPTHARSATNERWRPYPLMTLVRGRNTPADASQYKEMAWTIPYIKPGDTSIVLLRAKLTQRPTP